jgi:hypothetical protein
MGQLLTCDICGEEFENIWTIEEAAQEYEKRTGKPLPSDAKIVCDECCQKEII